MNLSVTPAAADWGSFLVEAFREEVRAMDQDLSEVMRDSMEALAGQEEKKSEE